MNMNRLSVIAVCFAMCLAVIAGPVYASDKDKHEDKHENKNKHKKKGYPNGKGWQAVKKDFRKVNRKLNRITKKIGSIDEKVDYIADDVYMLKNTLQVQVRVETIKDEASIDLIGKSIVMFVQVIKNGRGVTDLTADSFKYVNSFPENAAKYCGAPCFSEGKAGQYALELEGDWNPGVYAGTLGVHSEYEDMTSYGTSQVIVEILEPPMKP